MPRKPPDPPPPPSDRNAWLIAFGEALQQLRPHLSDKLATAIARANFSAELDPGAAAQQYHQQQGGAAPAHKRAR